MDQRANHRIETDDTQGDERKGFVLWCQKEMATLDEMQQSISQGGAKEEWDDAVCQEPV